MPFHCKSLHLHGRWFVASHYGQRVAHRAYVFVGNPLNYDVFSLRVFFSDIPGVKIGERAGFDPQYATSLDFTGVNGRGEHCGGRTVGVLLSRSTERTKRADETTNTGLNARQCQRTKAIARRGKNSCVLFAGNRMRVPFCHSVRFWLGRNFDQAVGLVQAAGCVRFFHADFASGGVWRANLHCPGLEKAPSLQVALAFLLNRHCGVLDDAQDDGAVVMSV